MKKRYYLAYGSNLNIRQMKCRCPSAKIIGTGVVKDHRLLFKGSKTGSYLTVEPCAGRSVPVGVWEVSKGDEEALDRYEGFPDFYCKKELIQGITDIHTGKSRTRRCFIYIMSEDRPVGIPSPNYMRVCREGYRDFGFDGNVLLRAYDESEEAYFENE